MRRPSREKGEGGGRNPPKALLELLNEPRSVCVNVAGKGFKVNGRVGGTCSRNPVVEHPGERGEGKGVAHLLRRCLSATSKEQRALGH